MAAVVSLRLVRASYWPHTDWHYAQQRASTGKHPPQLCKKRRTTMFLTPAGESHHSRTETCIRILLKQIFYGWIWDSIASEVTKLSLCWKCMEVVSQRNNRTRTVQSQTSFHSTAALPTTIRHIKQETLLIIGFGIILTNESGILAIERYIKPLSRQTAFPEVRNAKGRSCNQDSRNQFQWKTWRWKLMGIY